VSWKPGRKAVYKISFLLGEKGGDCTHKFPGVERGAKDFGGIPFRVDGEG